MKTKLILDLDGVLITTPSWKADEIEFDNYSKFNSECVENLNNLLLSFELDIWLISTRRTVKTLEEFNIIFKNRKITQKICGFVPEYGETKNRKEEVIRFVEDNNLKNYIIIDDDKSLNGLNTKMKENLILTELMKGFNLEKLNDAKNRIKKSA
jgi:hypothetical protein